MTDKPNLLVFAVSLAGAITTGLWLVQYTLGAEPSWGQGIVLFFFLVLGAVAFRGSREYRAADNAADTKAAAERVAVAERWAAIGEPPPSEPVLTEMSIDGRAVVRWRAADPHEAVWRDVLADFMLHAWAARSLSGPDLVGRAVKFNSDWYVLTDVLVASGILKKVNGVGTFFRDGWTYRRAVRAIQLGEVPVVIPAKPKSPPTVFPVHGRVLDIGSADQKLEAPRSRQKAAEAT